MDDPQRHCKFFYPECSCLSLFSSTVRCQVFHADNRIQQEKSERDMWKDWHTSNYFSVVRLPWMEKGKRQQVGRHTLQGGYVGENRQRPQEEVLMLPKLVRAIASLLEHFTPCGSVGDRRPRNLLQIQKWGQKSHSYPFTEQPTTVYSTLLSESSEKRESRGREEGKSQ